jgi:HAD superfamily hydrolase (TIGR01509 family)
MIKAIVFDLDGVYFPSGVLDFFKNVAKKYNVSAEKAKEAWSSEKVKEYWAGKINKEEYWSFFADHLGISASPEELISLFLELYTVDARIASLVRKVRKDFKTIIFTNNFKERFESLDQRFDFVKDFDFVILSYQVGEIKPSKEMFSALTEKTKCKNEEILVIDDDLKGINSLKEKGFQAIHYTDYENLTQNLKELNICGENTTSG